MNCAVHGLSGDIRQGNTYYEDEHKSLGKFDFVMANPPFNVDGVDKEKIKDDKRFSYGIPKPDNANYLWIQIFLNALNNKGRAGFVMANGAESAKSEMEIRKKMLEDEVMDVMKHYEFSSREYDPKLGIEKCVSMSEISIGRGSSAGNVAISPNVSSSLYHHRFHGYNQQIGYTTILKQHFHSLNSKFCSFSLTMTKFDYMTLFSFESSLL